MYHTIRLLTYFYKAALIFCYTNFSAVPLFAQLRANDFQQFTTREGLTDDLITGVEQDKRGYLWIGTSRGLNRYGGNSFQQFHAGVDDASLPVDNIGKLQWLDEERLAVLTSMGLHIINTKTGSRYNLIIPAGEIKYAFKVNSPTAVLGNKTGDVFILTRSGFYHYDNSNRLIFRFDYYSKEDAETRAFGYGSNMIWMDEELILLETIDGLQVYNTISRTITQPDNQHYPFLNEFNRNRNFVARPIKPGRFFIINALTDSIIFLDITKNRKVISRIPFSPFKEFGYRSASRQINDSLFYITGYTNGFYKFIIHSNGNIKVDPQKYLPDFFCSAIISDRDGRIWIGTNKGLLKEQNRLSFIQSASIPADSTNPVPAPSIQQVLVFKDKIYAACRREGGVQVFDKNSMKFIKKIDLKKRFHNSNAVFSIVQANDDTLLIGTYGPLFWYKTSTEEIGEIRLEDSDRETDWVAAQLKDSKGDAWICLASGKIYHYDKIEGRFKKLVIANDLFKKILVPFHIIEDEEGNIWFGGHGLCRYNRASGRVDLLLDSFPFIRFPRKEIDALAIDHRNTIWFENAFNGLINYNPASGEFRHFTQRQGLPDNSIKALKLIKDKLWISTPSGIASMNLTSKKIAAYGTYDGFPAASLTGTAFFYDFTNNQLYIGFDNNLVRFNPDSLVQQKKPPQLFIESVRFADNKSYLYPAETIQTTYAYNSFQVIAGSINFSDVQNQRFGYRLIHTTDTTWKYMTGDAVINFNNLAPGNYQLEVKLSAANNRWPDQLKNVVIIIAPPFWLRPWFLVLIGLFLAGVTYLLYKNRIRNIRQKANIDKLLAQTEMKALHAQMNPHFIFNSLNSIREMILCNENKQASHYLSKFAHLIRTTLDQSGQSFVSLRSTIDYLNRYIEMELIRNSNFTCEIKAQKELDPDETILPPMLIQPFIENAIWHGITSQHKNICIYVEFKKDKDQLICTIDDTGIGIEQSLKFSKNGDDVHQPLGINNIRHRIRLLNEKYNLKSSVSIEDKNSINRPGETGTLVTLRLPLELKEE